MCHQVSDSELKVSRTKVILRHQHWRAGLTAYPGTLGQVPIDANAEPRQRTGKIQTSALVHRVVLPRYWDMARMALLVVG